jgi:hypothetical protein
MDEIEESVGCAGQMQAPVTAIVNDSNAPATVLRVGQQEPKGDGKPGNLGK